MRLYTGNEIQKWEKFTYENSAIDEASLMVLASTLVANWIDKKLVRDDINIAIVTGWGNNGGDGFTVARILRERGLSPKVYDLSKNNKSKLCQLMASNYNGELVVVNNVDDLQDIVEYDIVIDAILGIGANRAFSEPYLTYVKYLNENANYIMSIDIPSGMLSEGITKHETINANETLSFTSPKLSFFSSSNSDRLGKWIIRDLKLANDFHQHAETQFHYIDRTYIKGRIKTRSTFSHKGNYGHVIVIGGEIGKAGSVCLAAEAAYRIGSGLVTIGSCESNRIIIQNSLRESMFLDMGENVISNDKFDFSSYDVIAIGPGLGINLDNKNIIKYLFSEYDKSLVIDADGLNTIAEYEMQDEIPKLSILTPHPKEFDRLFGKHENDIQRRKTQQKESQEKQIYIVLKGAYTSVSSPEGNLYFNSTGNPGMATGGTGDILCGMIASFVGQSYSHEESCLLAVYLHGLAGDLASKDLGQECIIAGDLIPYFSKGYNMLK